MSNTGIPIVKDVSGLLTGGVSDIFKLGKKAVGSLIPDAPSPTGLPSSGDPAVANRTAEFATREASIKRQAVAAGAQRSENDADLLGYTPARRKSAAARHLLGG
jgi:hypothetical protein